MLYCTECHGRFSDNYRAFVYFVEEPSRDTFGAWNAERRLVSGYMYAERGSSYKFLVAPVVRHAAPLSRSRLFVDTQSSGWRSERERVCVFSVIHEVCAIEMHSVLFSVHNRCMSDLGCSVRMPSKVLLYYYAVVRHALHSSVYVRVVYCRDRISVFCQVYGVGCGVCRCFVVSTHGSM